MAGENEDDAPFTPQTLEACAKQLEALRAEYLFGIDGAGADPFAEQFYISALGFMELAMRHFKLAQQAQSRALAGGR